MDDELKDDETKDFDDFNIKPTNKKGATEIIGDETEIEDDGVEEPETGDFDEDTDSLDRLVEEEEEDGLDGDTYDDEDHW